MTDPVAVEGCYNVSLAATAEATWSFFPVLETTEELGMAGATRTMGWSVDDSG